MRMAKTNNLYIAILGLGTVGNGVYKILNDNAALIKKRTGKNLIVKTVLEKDLSRKKLITNKNVQFTSDINAVINDPAINVVVETMGGENPAYPFICQALKAKKFVVTANKEVVSKYKKELTNLAKDHGVDIYYEASVGGGIPIIRTLKAGFAPEKINSIYGILNGTTNFILTKIEEEQKEFTEVLKEAQSLGFAEKNPTMDVTGLDTAFKLIILAAVAFKVDVKLTDIAYEGIQKISLRDITYAKELGLKIKLLAIGKRLKNNTFAFSVQPVMLPQEHPLSAVRNEFNAIFIVGENINEAMLYGKGAGAAPTGSAIVSDIMDISYTYPQNNIRNLEYDFKSVKMTNPAELYAKFYLRLLVKDTYGVLEKITNIFGQHKISLSKVIQKDEVKKYAEIVIMTHKVKETNMKNSIKELQKLTPLVHEVCSLIKVGIDNL
jgi:homoserine dehydrogenase